MSVTGADLKKVKAVTADFLAKLGVDLEADVSANTDGVKINLTGKDSAIIIGYHGETLADLAYLLGLVIKKAIDKEDRVRIDVAGYLETKDKKIKEITLRAIEKVRKNGFPEDLVGLNAYERRVAHTVAAKEGFHSESTGFGKDRKIVIKPMKYTETEEEF